MTSDPQILLYSSKQMLEREDKNIIQLSEQCALHSKADGRKCRPTQFMKMKACGFGKIHTRKSNGTQNFYFSISQPLGFSAFLNSHCSLFTYLPICPISLYFLVSFLYPVLNFLFNLSLNGIHPAEVHMPPEPRQGVEASLYFMILSSGQLAVRWWVLL